MFWRIKKRTLIFLAGLFCLLSLAGGIIYVIKKRDEIAKNSNDRSIYPEKNLPPYKERKMYSRIKIKKTNIPNILLLSQNWGKDGSGGSSEMSLDIKNMSEIIQGFVDLPEDLSWKKEIWTNLKAELKNNLWLVKERQKLKQGKIIYYTWYEDDHGNKVSKIKEEG